MKKRQRYIILLSLCGSFLLLFGNVIAQAAESKEYESPAGVGFYGSYEYPVEESSTKESQSTQKSEDSAKISSETEVSKATNINNQDEMQSRKKLPYTGEQVNRYIRLIGVFILVIMALIIFINRKKNKKIEENK